MDKSDRPGLVCSIMARPGPRKPHVSWRPAPALLARIRTFQAERGYATRTQALDELVERGLTAAYSEPPAKGAPSCAGSGTSG
jgi:hypothetical protein